MNYPEYRAYMKENMLVESEASLIHLHRAAKLMKELRFFNDNWDEQVQKKIGLKKEDYIKSRKKPIAEEIEMAMLKAIPLEDLLMDEPRMRMLLNVVENKLDASLMAFGRMGE